MSIREHARRAYRSACGRVRDGWVMMSDGLRRAVASSDVRVGVVGVGVVLVAAAGWWVLRHRAPTAQLHSGALPTEVPVVRASPAMTRRWVDGVPRELPTSFDAVAVVMDNAPEARPQYGLAAAPLVFEVPVEGQRTRLLAVYPNDATGEVGPVRSARPYLVGIAEALHVPLVHVGGSAAALELLRARHHINQYYDPPFRRTPSRPAPFNVLTHVPRLAAFAAERGWANAHRESFALWLFAPEATAAPSDGASLGRSVQITYGRESAFDVTWTYDAEHAQYVRTHHGEIVHDESGAPIVAVNVVVLRVRSQVLDAVGRLRISSLEPPIPKDAADAQSATVLTSGTRHDGTWQWSDGDGVAGRFGLQDVHGKLIALHPGTTWVEIVNVPPEFE